MSKAIQIFQANNGLDDDGVIGKNTINKMLEVWKLSNAQLSHFLGQTHEESGEFEKLIENLNYSAEGLLSIFPKYFNPQTAKQYERQPEKIANHVYSNRMGNDVEQSGEGWKYRGRGCIQLTGKNNYTNFSKYIQEDCLTNPDLVANKYPFESALYFFKSNNLWILCNNVGQENIKQLTKRINGGYTNLDKRIANTIMYYDLINK